MAYRRHFYKSIKSNLSKDVSVQLFIVTCTFRDSTNALCRRCLCQVLKDYLSSCTWHLTSQHMKFKEKGFIKGEIDPRHDLITIATSLFFTQYAYEYFIYIYFFKSLRRASMEGNEERRIGRNGPTAASASYVHSTKLYPPLFLKIPHHLWKFKIHPQKN